MDDYLEGEIRSGDEIARRALALSACVAVARGEEGGPIIRGLRDSGIEHDLSPNEARFVTDPSPSAGEVADFRRQSERLVVLLWALGLSEMPNGDEPADPDNLRSLLPPDNGESAGGFIAGAEARPDAEIDAQAERIWNLHWQARDGGRHHKGPRDPVDMDIIMERHHAINWVKGYMGEEWDEVTTDT